MPLLYLRGVKLKGGTNHMTFLSSESSFYIIATLYLISDRELCTWLWAKLLQQVFDNFMKEHNSYRVRKDNGKAGPSGMSRNTACLPETWGGENCLLPVDKEVIQRIKEEMGGDELLEFVSQEFSKCAEAAYHTLGVQKLSFENIWQVFMDLHENMFS